MSTVHGNYAVSNAGSYNDRNTVRDNLKGMFDAISELVNGSLPIDVIKSQIEGCLDCFGAIITQMPDPSNKQLFSQLVDKINSECQNPNSDKVDLQPLVSNLCKEGPSLLKGISRQEFDKALPLMCEKFSQNLVYFKQGIRPDILYNCQGILTTLSEMPCFHKNADLNQPIIPPVFFSTFYEFLPNAIGDVEKGNFKDALNWINTIETAGPPTPPSQWYTAANLPNQID